MPTNLQNLFTQGVTLQGDTLLVRTPTRQDAEDLVRLMREDHQLRQAAAMTEAATRETPAGFLQVCATWWNRQRTLVMAIVRHNVAIGTISLARIDPAQKTAGIGYWVGSAHWRQGVATEAFGLVLDLAITLGLERVTDAKIRADNPASWRLWQRYGPVHIAGQYAICDIDLRTLPGPPTATNASPP